MVIAPQKLKTHPRCIVSVMEKNKNIQDVNS